MRSGVPMFFNAIIPRHVQMQVRCPNCGHPFAASALRRFGALSPEGVRWMMVGIVALCAPLVFVLPPR